MTGKTVLITGCSSGFGKAMVHAFLKAGWTVYATMRNAAERKNIFASEKEVYKDDLRILELDVTSAQDRRAVAESLPNGLDCLINNAGYMSLGALENFTEEEIRQQFEVNFFGTALLTQELLPQLRLQRGMVINISSVFGFLTWPLTSVYCASKYAIEGLTESLRQELQPYGVRVALIEPGGYHTNLNDNTRWGSRMTSDRFYEQDTKGYKDWRAQVKGGTELAGNEVARIALRLAQKKSPPLRTQAGRGISWAFRFSRFFPQWFGNSFMNQLARRAFRRVK